VFKFISWFLCEYEGTQFSAQEHREGFLLQFKFIKIGFDQLLCETHPLFPILGFSTTFSNKNVPTRPVPNSFLIRSWFHAAKKWSTEPPCWSPCVVEISFWYFTPTVNCGMAYCFKFWNVIEGLRPPKFQRGNFCVFCFHFQALAFSCPPCLASLHSLTCIFYWVWQHVRPSLPGSPLN